MIEAELLQGFIEEAEAYLPEIRDGVVAYSQDAKCIGELQNARRQAQTIKGAAMMIGLDEVGRISGEIEVELEKTLASMSSLSKQNSLLLLDMIANLEFTLALTRESIHGICIKTDELDDDFFGPLQLDESNPESAAEAESGFEDFEIDTEMLEVFAMEAEDHLRNIQTHLGILEKDVNDREALLEIRRSAHTLKGSAGIVGFKKLSALAHRIEDLLDYLAEHEIESNSSVFELLLDSTDCLGQLTNGQNSLELDQKIGEIYMRFSEAMETLQAGQISALPQLALPEQDEVDEIVATFAPIETKLEPPAKSEKPESSAAAHGTESTNRVTRVSLERLDDLVKLVSEMVINRSVFEQRLFELEQQIDELQHTTNRLRRSTGKLEVDFEASTLGSRNFSFPTFGYAQQNIPSLFEKETDEFDVLEFDQYTEFHQTTRELIEATGDTSSIHNGLESLRSNLSSLFDTQRRLIEEMQTSLLRLRMVPLNSIAPRLQRTVRVTAAEEGKVVDFEIENGWVEIDTQIMDAFVEPVIHLLRNAIAHGIEPVETRFLLGKSEKGKITLRAYSEGTHIVFVVTDDGRGISVAALKEKAISMGFISKKEADTMVDEDAFSLVFLPGLSTTNEINEVSGRGVGMNVVKSNITRRHGTISIKSEPQKGTSFTIRLPMSMAVTRSLLVKADTQKFAFPLKLVKKVIEISTAELQRAFHEKELKLDGVSYAFFHFNELLNIPFGINPVNGRIPLLLLETAESPCALAVEQLTKPEEIVIKPLGSLFQNIPEIIGATILGDGGVVPVLDLVYLIRKKPVKNRKPAAVAAKVKAQANVLIVDDSPSVRQVNSNLIKNAGWQVSVAKDGLEALEMLQTGRNLPDIILTDVEMPRMDGYELLALLKRQETLRKIPVIMITSRSGDKHRRKAYDLGVSEYLTKPYEESVLIKKIQQLLNLG